MGASFVTVKVEVIRRIISISGHFLSYSLDTLIFLLILLAFLLKTYTFQTWLAQRVAAYFESELNTKISIERVEIDIFKRLLIRNLYIEDHHGDTLLFTHKLEGSIESYSLSKEFIRLDKVTVNNPRIKLKQYSGEHVLNFQFIADYFADDSPKDPESKPFRIYANSLKLKDANFSMDNENKRPKKRQMDFDHLHVFPLSATVSDFRLHGDTTVFELNDFTVFEKSGLYVKHMKALVKVAPDGVLLQEMRLKTLYSSLYTPRLFFKTRSFEDFDDFENKVFIEAKFENSLLSMRDISYFSNDLYGASHQLILNGRLAGTLNNLRLHSFTVGTSPENYVNGNFVLKNITTPDSLYAEAEVYDMHLGMQQLALIEVPPYNATQFLDIPEEILRMGVIKGKGNFVGTPYNYVASFEATTYVGGISGKMTYSEKKKQGFVAEIDVQTSGLNVGIIADNKNLGKLTSVLRIHGYGEKMNEFARYDVVGEVKSVFFSDYEYHNIKLDGDLSKLIFDGHFHVDDPNLVMTYNGKLDLRRKIPEFNFRATIDKANLHTLNLIERKESTSVACVVHGEGKGDDLDNFRGKINVDSLVLTEEGKKYRLQHMELVAVEEADKSKKTLTFDSDILYARFDGLFNFSELPKSFMSVVSKAVPAFFDNKTIIVHTKEIFNFELAIRDFSMISALFIPDLTMSKNVVITGKFNSQTNVFRLRSEQPIQQIKFKDQYLENVTKIDARNNDDLLTLTFKSDRLVLNDSVDLQKLSLVTQGLNNNFASNIDWSNKPAPDMTEGNSGKINLIGAIRSHDSFEIKVDSTSQVRVKQGLWKLQREAIIGLDSSVVSITNFFAKNDDQSLQAEGRISKNPRDTFTTAIHNFDLASITPLLVGKDLELEGRMNGDFKISQVYATPHFETDMRIDSFKVNQEYVGLVTTKAFYEEANERIYAEGKVIRKEIPDIDFSGYYYTKRKEDALDFSVTMKDANLKLINGFLPPDISNFRGLADGKFTLTGTPEAPEFRGKIFIHDGFVKINMLNTSYFFGNGSMTLEDGMITVDNMVLEDVRGHTALVNATYYHENFSNSSLSFDISQMEKLLVLNTTEEMNPLYYGKAYASGSVSMLMYKGKMDVEINVRTDKNTRIFLPLYGDEDVSLGDFVEFETHDTAVVKPPVSLDDISLTFNLEVTPDAEINIIFDPISGQSLKARGRGDIEMRITPSGEFFMEGPYVVEDGEFKFALKSFISKNFKVAKGSRITWYGDPYLAELDIRTIYYAQTSLFPLMPPDLANNYRKNTEVQCIMYLKNTLENPLIGFDIVVPRADDNIKSVLNSIRSNEQELTTQFFTLLVVNSFVTPSTGVGNNTQSSGSSMAANYTSELLANKFNSMLSKATGNVDLGFNYKPGDNISNNEIAVALSTQSKNGRLVLSGNVGVSQGNSINNNPSSIIGDFNLEYMLNEEGDVRLRAYNESNEFNITNVQQSPYTQGVAVFYQKEFDGAKELYLWQRFLNVFRSADKDVAIPEKKKKKKKQKTETQKGIEEKEKKEGIKEF